MTWEQLSTLPPLRDATGTIMLEEADDDTRTATFRIYGRSSLTATVAWDGACTSTARSRPKLRTALAPPGFGRFVAAGNRP